MTYEELLAKLDNEKSQFLKSKIKALGELQEGHYAYLAAFGSSKGMRDDNIPSTTREKMQKELKDFDQNWNRWEIELEARREQAHKEFLSAEKEQGRELKESQNDAYLQKNYPAEDLMGKSDDERRLQKAEEIYREQQLKKEKNKERER